MGFIITIKFWLRRHCLNYCRPQEVARYLAEFQYWFNRRNDLAGMLSRLSYVSLHTPPMPYKLLTLAEASA